MDLVDQMLADPDRVVLVGQVPYELGRIRDQSGIRGRQPRLNAGLRRCGQDGEAVLYPRG